MSLIMEERTVARTALLASTGPVGARDGWLVLHGLNQRVEQFGRAFVDAPGGQDRRVLLPEGLSRSILDTRTDKTGACWTTIPDRPRDLRDAFAWIEQAADQLEAQTEPRDDGLRVLIGFSQGGILAARLCAQATRRWDAVVLWGSAIPRGLDPRAVVASARSGKLHLIVGDKDRYATPERRALMREGLAAAGVETDVLVYEGGHEVTAEAVALLAERLEALRPARARR